MDFSFRFDRWFRKLPQSPRDLGRVKFLVVRPPNVELGARETPQQVEVDPQFGVLGDRWNPETDPEGSQVSLMNWHVLQSLAKSQSDMAPAGDNLIVDLDLSEASLPVGAELSIGTAVLQVTDQPHRPCAKFHERYGVQAARKVARANRKGKRGRGVMCRVLQAGTISIGDQVRVQRERAESQ